MRSKAVWIIVGLAAYDGVVGSALFSNEPFSEQLAPGSERDMTR
jgi:hypothetical protein